MRALIVTALALFVSGCGSSAAGTYAVDADAMAPEIEKFVETLLGPQLAALENKGPQTSEAKLRAREKLRRRFTLEVTLRDDDTYVAVDGGRTRAAGTWRIDGSELTLTVTEENSAKLASPRTIKGTYEDDTIRFRPDEKLPFDYVLRRK